MAEPMQVDPIAIDEIPNGPTNQSASDLVIHGEVPIDLEYYVANYSGYIKYQRLMFIAQHCRSLAIEALKLAHDYVKNNTYDVNAYNHIFSVLTGTQIPSSGTAPGSTWPLPGHSAPSGAASGGPGHAPLSDAVSGPVGAEPLTVVCPGGMTFVYDAVWAESTKRKGALNLERMDTDLKNYKANSIKESIRRGCDDMGDLYLQLGDLNNALKCYSRARDYCTSYRQELNMCLNVIRVAILLRNWSQVNTHVNRAESLPDVREPPSSPPLPHLAAALQAGPGAGAELGAQGPHPGSTSQREFHLKVRTKLNCFTGLVELACSNYKAAARSFLLASYDHCDIPTVLTVSNVAHYGGLCALATFDRPELKARLLNSPTFRQFLEAEPEFRDVIHNFYNSQYGDCLRALDRIRDFLRLDIFLSEHINYLYKEIRNRALCQYFSPYLSADLNRMARAFNTTVQSLEDELTTLILEGNMNARIDSHGQILHSRSIDQRCCTFERALHLVDEYKKRVNAVILRTALSKYKICVKSSREEEDAPSFSSRQ